MSYFSITPMYWELENQSSSHGISSYIILHFCNDFTTIKAVSQEAVPIMSNMGSKGPITPPGTVCAVNEDLCCTVILLEMYGVCNAPFLGFRDLYFFGFLSCWGFQQRLLGCIWIKDLVREKEMKMKKLDVRNFGTIGSSTISISISFFITKSLIQTQP